MDNKYAKTMLSIVNMADEDVSVVFDNDGQGLI